MKWRKHSSTDKDSRRDPLSWASFDNGKDRLMKGSNWIRLLPHLLHSRTDLRVPSKIVLIASGRKDQHEFIRAERMSNKSVEPHIPCCEPVSSGRIEYEGRGMIMLRCTRSRCCLACFLLVNELVSIRSERNIRASNRQHMRTLKSQETRGETHVHPVDHIQPNGSFHHTATLH